MSFFSNLWENVNLRPESVSLDLKQDTDFRFFSYQFGTGVQSTLDISNTGISMYSLSPKNIQKNFNDHRLGSMKISSSQKLFKPPYKMISRDTGTSSSQAVEILLQFEHISCFSLCFSSCYLKLLISQSKFSGTRKFTLRYQ